jgi:hypothetical protein
MVDPGALIRSGRAERVSYEYLDIAMGVPPSSLEPVHTAARIAYESRGGWCFQVRKTSEVGPEVGPTLTFLYSCMYSHRNAWADLHLLGQPDTLLAPAVRRLRVVADEPGVRSDHGRWVFILPHSPLYFIIMDHP